MRLLVPFAIASLALSLLACGPSVQPAAEPKTAASAQPKSGGILTVYAASSPGDWDMRTQGKTSVNVQLHSLAYETLLRFKKGPDVEYSSQILEPRLAEKWTVSPDAKTFTFQLRKGVKFQDLPPVGGRDLTSGDVKWSLEYYAAREMDGKKLPPSAVEFMYDGLDKVTAPDPNTVVVQFKEPYVPFLNYAASQWMPIGAKEVHQKDGSLQNTLVGSGPFIFDDKASQKGTLYVLKKNPAYWDSGKPYLDGIRRLILPEVATAVAAFQTKQLDVFTHTEARVAADVIKGNPDAGVFKTIIPIGNALLISQRRGGPLADVRVRKAISLALDREEHSKIIYAGEGKPFLAGSWPGLFTEAQIKDMLPYNPEQAKKLLAEAGVATPLSLEMIVSETVSTQEQLIQSQLKNIGIDMKLSVLPREQHRPRLYSGDYDFYRNGGGGLLEADVDSFLYGEFYSGSSLNWSQMKDPELDKLVLTTRRELDSEKRKEAIRAAARRINEQAWDPGIVYPPSWAFSQPYVRNWRPHFTQGEAEAFVWLDK